MRINHVEILEKVCKDVIETILMCLDHATKGTVYLIGPMPELRAVRITSGIRKEGNGELQWGLPEISDYNPPGKTWLQYRDEPGRPLEAMAWCVEHQKSWTADNPMEDARSVRKQLMGEPEDFHHMEPVLLRKSEIYEYPPNIDDYPKTWDGSPIWQDTDYAVVAVIKIHFLPNSIRRGDRSTKLIKQLARRFGSELLSLHLKEFFYEARRQLDQMRIESCNVLAHELRNPIMKLGFIASAINTEIALFREVWEDYLKNHIPNLNFRKDLIRELNKMAMDIRNRIPLDHVLYKKIQQVIDTQQELIVSNPIPDKAREKIDQGIALLWEAIFKVPGSEVVILEEEKERVRELIYKLREAIYYGIRKDVVRLVNHIPEELKDKWVDLAYREFSFDDLKLLDELLDLLEKTPDDIPHGYHIQKNLFYLKTLAEVVQELNARVAKIIETLRNTKPVISWMMESDSRKADIENGVCGGVV
ncbi:MAG: hypothetical protein N2260_07720 [Syntrophobacterales bacterium]|nr:hypothetical protein [Syntrophobacterales bacterium]